MENQLKSRILAGLAYAQVEAHESALRFGNWERRRTGEELAVQLHRHVSRVMEITIAGDGRSPRIDDVTNLEEALADVIIQVLDFAAGKNLSVAAATLAKLEYNESLSQLTKKDY